MIRILFVCHGNICRSPMAEFVMKALVDKQGLSSRFEIASAATHTDALGYRPHRGTRERLALVGISTEGKQARLINRADYNRYDYIVAMDEWNVYDLERTFSGDPDHKISLLLAHAGINREVADPWYTGDFNKTYDDVYLGCTALLNKLTDGRQDF